MSGLGNPALWLMVFQIIPEGVDSATMLNYPSRNLRPNLRRVVASRDLYVTLNQVFIIDTMPRGKMRETVVAEPHNATTIIYGTNGFDGQGLPSPHSSPFHEGLFEAFRDFYCINAGILVTILLYLNIADELLTAEAKKAAARTAERTTVTAEAHTPRTSDNENSKRKADAPHPHPPHMRECPVTPSSWKPKSLDNPKPKISQSRPESKTHGVGMREGKRKVLFLGAFSSPSHATASNGSQIEVEGLRLMSEMRTFQKVFGAENALLLPAASWDDLVSASQRVSPTVVHLSGHCFEEKWVFEGESRAVSCVSGDQLGELFLQMTGLKVIVLSGCQSSKLARAIKKRIRGKAKVICSTTKLNNTFASTFCGDLYTKLVENADDFKDPASVSEIFETIVHKHRNSDGLKFGDPTPILHKMGPEGVPIMNVDHLGKPHHVDFAGRPVFSPHCWRCNPPLGGKFEMM